MQLLLSLRRLGTGLEHVLLRLGLSDLSLQRHQALLQGLHLSVLCLDLGIQRCGGLLEGLATAQRLTGQVLFALLQGQLGTFVPGFRLRLGLFGLVAEPLLAGDRHGHRLAQLHQVRLHVGDGLIKDLGWILQTTDGGVGIGAHQSAQPVEEAHGEIQIRAEVSQIRRNPP